MHDWGGGGSLSGAFTCEPIRVFANRKGHEPCDGYHDWDLLGGDDEMIRILCLVLT